MRIGRVVVLALLLGAAARSEQATAPEAGCIACRSDAASLRGDLDGPTWRAVEAGEIVTREVPIAAREAGRAVEALGILDASPRRVWEVVTDHPCFPEFLPNAHETRVRRREADRVYISQHLRVAFVSVRYGAVWTLDPEGGRATWTLDPETENDVRRSDGSWQLAPLEGGARTLARYRADVETGQPLPAGVERMLTHRSLPRVIDGVRTELARRARGDGSSRACRRG